MKPPLKTRLKALLALTLLTALTTAPALAEEIEKPTNTRIQLPLVISLDTGWPKGLLNLNAHYALLPNLSLGASVGFAFSPTIGAFGRWYFAETPGSTYVEVLATQSIGSPPPTTGGPTSFVAPSFFSLNGLFGWEHRAANGWTLHAAVGLGVSPNMAPGIIMGLVNVDLGVGYAF